MTNVLKAGLLMIAISACTQSVSMITDIQKINLSNQMSALTEDQLDMCLDSYDDISDAECVQLVKESE